MFFRKKRKVVSEDTAEEKVWNHAIRLMEAEEQERRATAAGYCTNRHCGYLADDTEPEEQGGSCPCCGDQSIVSHAILEEHGCLEEPFHFREYLDQQS